jgi:phosphoglycolate phosphatase
MRGGLILFDFDYTLFDASGCLFPALRAGLRAVGLVSPPDLTLRRLIGIPLHQQFETFCRNRDPRVYEVFQNAYVKERVMREMEGTLPLPGVIPALATLKTRGFHLGVVSTGASKRILRALGRYKALLYFEEQAVIGGADNKTEAIRLAINRFRAKAQDTLYVGDRPEDQAASADAGVPFIGVTTGAFSDKDFPGDCVVLGSVAVLPQYLETTASAVTS